MPNRNECVHPPPTTFIAMLLIVDKKRNSPNPHKYKNGKGNHAVFTQ